jgi:hypothetical protein|tara:strand:- start:188 stop:430 length:243 start_codon:yes stop_codon:yes gene_type:complete
MKKNVLLINPAVNPESQSKIVNQMINKIFPTSIGILAGCLIERNVVESVRIIDEEGERGKRHRDLFLFNYVGFKAKSFVG